MPLNKGLSSRSKPLAFSRCPELGCAFPLVASPRCFLPLPFAQAIHAKAVIFRHRWQPGCPQYAGARWTLAPRDAAKPAMLTATLEISMDRETMQPRILIADDQQDVLDALRLLLKGHGYSIETGNSPAALLAAMGRQEFDILLIDLNYARDTTSGRDGLDVPNPLKELEHAPPLVP